MIITKTNIDSLDSLKGVTSKVSSVLKSPVAILLNGTLGAGKTTFTKFLISSIFGYSVDVISPTFNILQIYENNDILIYHYDFYRLQNENELINLDLDYALTNAITIIEWPEIAKKFVDSILEPDKKITFDIFFEEEKRFIQQV